MRLYFGQSHKGHPSPVRRRRLARSGPAPPGERSLRGANDAGADPRPPRLSRSNCGSLRSAPYGDDRFPDLVTGRTEALPGVALSKVFGKTETMGALYRAIGRRSPRTRAPRTSVWAEPSGHKLRVVDTDSGEDVARRGTASSGPIGAEPSFPAAADGEWPASRRGRVRVRSGPLSDPINPRGESWGAHRGGRRAAGTSAVADAAVAEYEGRPGREVGGGRGAPAVSPRSFGRIDGISPASKVRTRS